MYTYKPMFTNRVLACKNGSPEVCGTVFQSALYQALLDIEALSMAQISCKDLVAEGSY